MNKKYLVILEVSQKQAFIFSSNKLKENVTNSAIIAWVTSSKYFKSVIDNDTLYNEKENLVYAGGGHTVVVFDSHEQAKQFVSKVTFAVRKEYEGLEMFAKIHECNGEITNEDLKKLSEELEVKKAERKAAFHQGSFGVEAAQKIQSRVRPKEEEMIDEALAPNGFERVYQMERLGGTKGESNFIAVVHIDGNSMGKRVEDLRKSMEGMPWETYRAALRNFSESIDRDFKEAYHEMVNEVADQIMRGNLKQMSLLEYDFPVRRVITAGDDICFVTEGRIGIECAVIFMKKLAAKINKQDKKGYAACAGVAIVHQKYPFYRAYELAEELCISAKRYIATNAKGKDKSLASGSVCTIDWHIEYGEMKDSLEEIREMYRTADGNRLEMRPYIVLDPHNDMQEEIRTYENLKKQVVKLISGDMDYARGKLKEMRSRLRAGEAEAGYYLKQNRMEGFLIDINDRDVTNDDIKNMKEGRTVERRAFVKTNDGIKRSLLFDAIEIMDTYLSVEN